jgi:predicted O-methyltransferase YrrM
MNILTTIQQAIEAFGSETECLLPIVERRYDRQLFPSTGQYDWFSAQVLYCLVRLLKPQSIVEVSTSSGYSTLIQATALKRNQSGRLHTFEIDPELASAAAAAFRRFGLEEVVNLYVGDARVETNRLAGLPQPYILFLDSLHTEEFARWFINRWVLDAPADTLFHVHDVMPAAARVRIDGKPPWTSFDELIETVRDAARRLLQRPTTKSLGFVTPPVFPPTAPGELPTTNGVFYSEAVFINRVVEQMPAGSYVYLYDLFEHYPQLSPHRYDHQAIARQDRWGKPMEWNESIWTVCGEFSQAFNALKEAV